MASDPLAGPVTVRLATAGRHNAANALAVAGAAGRPGIDAAAIAAGLGDVPGVGRRLERKGEAAGVVVYDDYAHHPTAIRETLRAIRQREPGRRVWAVYEPLTYHRTAALLDDFADVLAGADARGHRRHLGRPRPGYDDRVGRGPGRRRRRPPSRR